MEDFDCVTGDLAYINSEKLKLEANGYLCKVARIGTGNWYSVVFWGG